jgi:hypothetical protein
VIQVRKSELCFRPVWTRVLPVLSSAHASRLHRGWPQPISQAGRSGVSRPVHTGRLQTAIGAISISSRDASFGGSASNDPVKPVNGFAPIGDWTTRGQNNFPFPPEVAQAYSSQPAFFATQYYMFPGHLRRAADVREIASFEANGNDLAELRHDGQSTLRATIEHFSPFNARAATARQNVTPTKTCPALLFVRMTLLKASEIWLDPQCV